MIKASKKMALIMAITMLFTTFATCMISTAAPTNLFADGDFERGDRSWIFKPAGETIACSDTATGFYVWDRNADPEGTTKIAQNKDNSLLIQPNNGSAKQIIGGIKPFTSYTLSYWVRTSTTANVALSPSIDFLNASNVNVGSLNSFGWPSTFLQAETNEWKKVEFQFTSPDIDTVANLTVYIANIGTEAAYLDNFSLIEDGGEPNYYRNGGLDLYNEKGQPWMWYAEDGLKTSGSVIGQDNYWDAATQSYTVGGGVYMYTETEADTLGLKDSGVVPGNRCFKFTASGNQYSYMFGRPVTLQAGNYKLSFRFRAMNGDRAPTLKFQNGPLAGTVVQNFQKTTKPAYSDLDSRWVKYDYYFTLDTAAADLQIRLMPFCVAGTYYIDDIVLTPDTTTQTVFARDMYTPADAGRENYVGDVYRPISCVTDSPKWYGNARAIAVKTHYVPTAASEDITVLNCLYKRETGGNRSLVSVSVKEYKGITKPTTVSETFHTPGDTDGVYTVESLVWDSVSGLRPILAPAVLPY